MPVVKSQSADPVKKAQLQKVRLYKPGSEEFEEFSPASARDMRRMGWSEFPNSGPVAAVRKSEQATKTVDGVTYYPIWSPTGVKEYHTAVNKRDLLANAAWKEVPPAKPVSVLAPEAVPVEIKTTDEPVAPEPVMQNVVVPGPDGPITVPDPTSVKTGMSAEDVLDDLYERAEAVKLKIDKRWGVATLQERVQEAEDAVKDAAEKLAAAEANKEVANDPVPPVPAPQDPQ